MSEQFNVHAIYCSSNVMFKRFNVQVTMLKRILMFKLCSRKDIEDKRSRTLKNLFSWDPNRQNLIGTGGSGQQERHPSTRHNPYRKIPADIKEKTADKSQEY